MAYQIEMAETGERFDAAEDESLLQTATRSGIAIPHDCQFSIKAPGPIVTQLSIELPDTADVKFRAGQYMNVLLDDGERRSFSMASAAGTHTLDFHVPRIAGGRFTDRVLSALAAGDPLKVELPLGSRVADHDRRCRTAFPRERCQHRSSVRGSICVPARPNNQYHLI